MSEDSPDNITTEIGQNTNKSLGHLRKLVVSQAPVEDYQR